MESLLELALRTSAANNDPYKDNVGVELLPVDLIFQVLHISENCSTWKKLTFSQFFLDGKNPLDRHRRRGRLPNRLFKLRLNRFVKPYKQTMN